MTQDPGDRRRKRMSSPDLSFARFASEAIMTPDFVGDFLEDLRRETTLPRITSRKRLRTYMLDVQPRACSEALEAADEFWSRYLQWKRALGWKAEPFWGR